MRKLLERLNIIARWRAKVQRWRDIERRWLAEEERILGVFLCHRNVQLDSAARRIELTGLRAAIQAGRETLDPDLRTKDVLVTFKVLLPPAYWLRRTATDEAKSNMRAAQQKRHREVREAQEEFESAVQFAAEIAPTGEGSQS